MQQKKPQKSRVKPAMASAANRRDSSPAVGFPNKIAQNQHPQALSDDFHYGHGHTGVQARIRPQDINVLIACEESQAERMAVEQKARQLALTLVGDDQNPQPLIEVLVEMAEWQRKQMMQKIHR